VLNALHIKQFTVFQDVQFRFSAGLNVIVGDNGTGKTHVLKLGYLFSRAWPDLTIKRAHMTAPRAESYLEERLLGLFRVSELDALVRHGAKGGARLVAEVGGHIPTVQIRMPNEPEFTSAGLPEPMSWEIRIDRRKGAPDSLKAEVFPDVVPDAAAANAFLPQQVFVPSKEVVSLFNGLLGLFDKYREFPLDETYRDLAAAMSTLEPREPPALVPEAMQRIQALLKGDLRLENGDLVFEGADGSRLESHLMAEGHRKLALLIYLLRHGVVERNSTVYWDEPEANLNPAALKLLAEALFVLTGLGVQVILATHSLFLLRELEILDLKARGKTPAPPHTRYFGLGWKGRQLELTQGDDIADIEPLVALDENLRQSDRYLEAGQ
jgi:hypothetical protein